jgi:allophanate hydrolase
MRKAMPQLTPRAPALRSDEVAVAVVGAHLSGMPLNGELRARNARFLETSKTAPDYKLFALPDSSPPKPGLLGVTPGSGHAIEVELWALSYESFGRFVSDIPPPLAIGTLTLADGRRVKGFLVEADATKRARDISEMGGWRAFVTNNKL